MGPAALAAFLSGIDRRAEHPVMRRGKGVALDKSAYPHSTITKHHSSLPRRSRGLAGLEGPALRPASFSTDMQGVEMSDPTEWLLEVANFGQYSEERDGARNALAEIARLRSRLDEVHSWIVCAAIASPEDMMQSAPRIEEITRPDAVDSK